MESISTPGINYIIFVMVTGALLLASVYHSVLFYYNRIRLIGNYALYLWSVFAYCFIRCFYIQQIPHLPYFSADEVLQMLSFALYIRFTKVAMELDPEKDKLAYRFTKIAPAVIAIYLVIHAISFGLFFSYKPIDPLYFASYIAIRAFLLLVGFICLMIVIKKRTSVYFRYIAYGVLSLIIIGMAATIIELFWKNNNYVDPLTILAVGYNIDLFFFSGAISYKMRTETVAKEQANKLVLEQQIEIQKNEMERLVISFKVKEEERSRIATELHDEIGSTISSISILSDVIIKEKNETSIKAMQLEIKGNSKLIMEKMDDIIWSLNPRNDSMEKMLLRIKQFATPLFEARNINYEYNIDNAVYALPLPIEQRQQAYLILKEAINNLIKHAACTEATITATKGSDNTLLFWVADNGKGYKTDNESSGNGLENMKLRARNMDAAITFVSSRGMGTTINLIIKLG